MILQLNLIAFDSAYCAGQQNDKCKIRFEQEMKTSFNQLSTIQLTVHFDGDHSKLIKIQLCNLIEMAGMMFTKKHSSFQIYKYVDFDLEEENPKIVQKAALVPASNIRKEG